MDQLLSRKYQLDLAAHAWPALEQQGPCFQSLAREVKAADGATGGSLAALAAALEAQPSLHAELRHFLTARIGVLAASMRLLPCLPRLYPTSLPSFRSAPGDRVGDGW